MTHEYFLSLITNACELHPELQYLVFQFCGDDVFEYQCFLHSRLQHEIMHKKNTIQLIAMFSHLSWNGGQTPMLLQLAWRFIKFRSLHYLSYEFNF